MTSISTQSLSLYIFCLMEEMTHCVHSLTAYPFEFHTCSLSLLLSSAHTLSHLPDPWVNMGQLNSEGGESKSTPFLNGAFPFPHRWSVCSVCGEETFFSSRENPAPTTNPASWNPPPGGGSVWELPGNEQPSWDAKNTSEVRKTLEQSVQILLLSKLSRSLSWWWRRWEATTEIQKS